MITAQARKTPASPDWLVRSYKYADVYQDFWPLYSFLCARWLLHLHYLILLSGKRKSSTTIPAHGKDREMLEGESIRLAPFRPEGFLVMLSPLSPGLPHPCPTTFFLLSLYMSWGIVRWEEVRDTAKFKEMDRTPFLREDPNKMLADAVKTSGEAENKYS